MSLFKIKKISISSLVLFLFLTPCLGRAYEIIDTSSDILGDFVLEPAKVELFFEAGESQEKVLNITNRTDKALEFKIEVEDFTGSQDPNQTVILLGEEKGPYSLKDFIQPEIDTFTLEAKQRIALPIYINVPLDAEPGGLYGSVLVSSGASPEGGAGTTVVSRLGALFFVGVNGDVNREGHLSSFVRKEKNNGSSFELLFANTGNVHLNPSGFIHISNILGSEIAEIEIKPYFAMPNSVRFREVDWEGIKLLGRYKAVVSINKGYDGEVEEMELIFWVISYKIIISILIILFMIIFISRWLIKNFDITREKKIVFDEVSGKENDKEEDLN